MKYDFKGLRVESFLLQPVTFIAECMLTPESGDDMAVLSKLMTGCTVHASSTDTLPSIKDVIFNPPATVVLWEDGTKTIVKCQDGDHYSKETGLALCMAKKAMDNSSRQFNDIFKKWIPEEPEAEQSIPRTCFTCRYGEQPERSYPCYRCLDFEEWRSED